jgi:hypothetical protein
MTEQTTKLSETERLIAAVEDVAQQLWTINATLERFMEITLVQLNGSSSGDERFALRTAPITD